ncbi:hypothetical protein CT113_10400 [Levilactobacillus brevis]|nr:hypothetical protein CT113_10400 [Levilactobacillus brevis]
MCGMTPLLFEIIMSDKLFITVNKLLVTNRHTCNVISSNRKQDPRPCLSAAHLGPAFKLRKLVD